MTIRVLVLLLLLAATGPASAQKLTVDTYHITVVNKAGDRVQGVFSEVTPYAIYIDAASARNPTDNADIIPLETVRKVILRRTNKRRAVRAGAIIGGLAFGYLTVEGLKKNPTRTVITSGLTLVLASGTGAAVGAGAGLLIGNIAHRVVRPRASENSMDDFWRQLEPFSVRYQTNVFKRINQ